MRINCDIDWFFIFRFGCIGYMKIIFPIHYCCELIYMDVVVIYDHCIDFTIQKNVRNPGKAFRLLISNDEDFFDFNSK